MASGAAKNGAKPLVVTNMTFIQRTYDQISQDVCINNNPVTILLNYTSFAGLTDVTHLGIFGISAFSNIPNLVILAPSSKSEYINMLDWSLDQKEHPVMILIPGNEVTERESDKDYDNIGKFKVEKQGEKAAIIALGDFYQMGESLAAAVKEKLGFTPTLINPRFASALDTDLLEEIGILAKNGKIKNDKIRKYNQIDYFVELMQGVLKEIGDRDEYVIFDAACGKSYLSFVMNFYLKEILKKKCHFIGVDYSETVIEASKLSLIHI
mgnify:FL=1